MIERNLHLSLTLYGRLVPRSTGRVALGMLVAIIVTTAWPFFSNRRRDRKLKGVVGSDAPASGDQKS
jgi:hypothetical protein